MADPLKPTIQDEELDKLISWFDTSLEALKNCRNNALNDRDFYDHDQWESKQAQELDARGQAPVVTNHIAQKVNYCLGEQIASRVDPAAWPQTPAHEEDADALTMGMRSVVDANDADIQQSEAFQEFLIEGTGALFVTQERVRDAVRILLQHVPWDRFAWDHMSRRRDFSDARWLGIVNWYDLEDAKAEYPDAGKMIEEAVVAGHETDDDVFEDWPAWWADAKEKRVRILQIFYRRDGEWYEAHITKHPDGWIRKPQKVKLTDDDGKTQCPLIAASAYVKRPKAKRPPERYGIVRGMIWAQQEINKRRSKALHFINMGRVIAEEGAFLMTKDEVLEELAKPDGYLVTAPGALQGGKIQIDMNLELAQSQFQLLQEAKAEIDAIGPQAPLVGTDERVQTGRSLDKRREAGEKQLKPVFDSFRFWQRRIYRAVAWKIKRYWPTEQWLRVTDDKERRGYAFVAINRPVTRIVRLKELLRESMPMQQAMRCLGWNSPVEADEMLEQATALAGQQVQAMAQQAQQNGVQIQQEQMQPLMQQALMQVLTQAPVMQVKFTQNKIGDIPVDIKIDVVPDSPVLQHEQFEKLAELAGTGQVAGITGDILIEASNIRNKKEILARMNPPPDPMAEQLKQIALAMEQARLETERAKAAELMGKAQEHQANVQFKLGPQAAKTQGQAMEAAAKAGEKTVPLEEEEP